MPKVCRWDGKVCSLPSCHTLSVDGYVELCIRHRNPKGRLNRQVSGAIAQAGA